MEKNILIIDIETTGFLNSGGKIVEVGLVQLDLESGRKKVLFDNVCHESGITLKEVQESWIIKNSDLSIEDIRHSKNLILYEGEIQSIINNHPLGCTAYNSSFDFTFMESRGFKFPKKLDCPMEISTGIIKIPKGNGFKWPSVQEAYDYFFPNSGYTEKHRGADDALREAEIFRELYLRGHYKI